VLDLQWESATAARDPLSADVPDGTQHIDWPDGSEYLGECVGGHPDGRGTFAWPSGIRGMHLEI
jgi:hypothetical protein